MTRKRPSMRQIRLFPLAVALALGGCATEEGAEMPDPMDQAVPETTLGPADGLDLPAVDLDRVRVGDPAPDFTLTSLAGPPVTLSQYRGTKDVILVFYRGHW